MRICICCIFACLFFACNSAEEIPAGGACSYRSEVHPAKLIGFKQQDSINIDAEFEVSWQSSKDTISYYLTKHSYLSAEQIKQDSLAIGNIYQYIEDFIVTGSCNPHITHLEMKLVK